MSFCPNENSQKKKERMNEKRKKGKGLHCIKTKPRKWVWAKKQIILISRTKRIILILWS